MSPMRTQYVVAANTAGDGEPVRLWTSPAMPADGTWLVEAAVVATSLGAGDNRHGAWVNDTAFASTAGEVAFVEQPGGTFTAATHMGIGIRVGVDLEARAVFLEARDDGEVAMKFRALVVSLEVT